MIIKASAFKGVKMRVAISAGHHPEAPGAAKNQLTEYHETAIIAGMLVNALGHVGIKAYLIGTGPLQKKVAEINAGRFDSGVEIHLNGGGGDGCETLFCPGSVIGRSFATGIQSALVARMPAKDRGVKDGWYRMDRPGVVDYPGDVDGDEKHDYILAETNCPFVIVEPFFIDGTDGGRHSANLSSYRTIAAAIAEGILNYKKQ
jgi:N-acetylmuramoyl-L-alanine amidase